MTIPESIQENYHYWHNFLETEVHFSLADSEKHTKDHCARVLLFALLIADKMALPHDRQTVLCAAAVFHEFAARNNARAHARAEGEEHAVGIFFGLAGCGAWPAGGRLLLGVLPEAPNIL